jgi:Uma2 family endonuclease
MAERAYRRATYRDLEALPENVVGEIIYGSLVTQPRPAALHARANSAIGVLLGGPFDRGVGGPGGWILLDEPELHLGAHVLVPDMAGWRRETMPELPDVTSFTVPPDFVCEVLSPSTEAIDRADKMPIYATMGVEWAWLVDPRAETLEIYRNERGRSTLVATHRGRKDVRAEPFDAIELSLDWIFSR